MNKEPTCEEVNQRGVNKGKICGRKANRQVNGKWYCNNHPATWSRRK